MKKILKLFLFSSIALSSIANASGVSYLTWSAGGYTPFSKDLKTNFYYALDIELLKFYDNGISIGFQGTYGNSGPKNYGMIDNGLLFGYRLLDSNYNFTIFSGIGISSEIYLKNKDNKKITSLNMSPFVPIMIWNRYELNKNLALYLELQYNFNFWYAGFSFNDQNDQDNKAGHLEKNGHEVKFNLGLEYYILNVGLFTNFYSLPHPDKNRINNLVYGAKIGFAF